MEIEIINRTAQEIFQVLKCDMPKLMSWGATGFRAGLYDNMACLEFKVNGFLHKGKVVVALNAGADLYEVFCIDKKGRVSKHGEGIYCDQLSGVIDALVEKDCPEAEYRRKCREWLKDTNTLKNL